jgi:hypothetical protein
MLRDLWRATAQVDADKLFDVYFTALELREEQEAGSRKQEVETRLEVLRGRSG